MTDSPPKRGIILCLPITKKVFAPLLIESLGAKWSNLMTAYSLAVQADVRKSISPSNEMKLVFQSSEYYNCVFGLCARARGK